MSGQTQGWNDFDSELVIGLVGATGTELDAVSRELESPLKQAGYAVHHIQFHTT